MGKIKNARPTDGELEILRMLWEHGPSTVRQVHENLAKETGYTTVLKLLQIMTEKGLVLRDETSRTHVYRARLRQEETQRHLLRDLVDRAFRGSAAQLVVQALAARKTSKEELAQIRKLLDSMERKHE